ncbi:methyltransferase domain-containing protein [Aquariibacter albus]|uniref:Methyltransferase domain-containing protein n=1 Tax=Aquariibacter albus TaxID=2759899 RepID=A0A839HN77_9BURK|nr:methyltransferase domain-containing protein [Aquariibacter albus]MBB1160860.1 methyltransferase domain-containing protein [Aquariibacter albus]
MAGPTLAFWQQRFDTGQTGWDRGAPSPQLLDWLDRGQLQPCRIAVPGCGSGWEVAELARRGFDVTGLDYTPAAVERSRARCADQGLNARIVQADVLQHRPEAPFDAIYEQTCLCALHPEHWQTYAGQLHRWLRPGGLLAVLFMQVPNPEALASGLIQGPPYHCDIHGMRALLPEARWHWPKPPYVAVPHPNRGHELAVVLTRR